ncbi:hypothetical protein EDD15DRAFT_2263156 [Pisolithus albus]|nr:hypothetical protein EDD15DRAFT_2263156 [Pisolithus albus]
MRIGWQPFVPVIVVLASSDLFDISHGIEQSFELCQLISCTVADHLERHLGCIGRSRRMTGFVQNLPKVSPNGESTP